MYFRAEIKGFINVIEVPNFSGDYVKICEEDLTGNGFTEVSKKHAK